MELPRTPDDWAAWLHRDMEFAKTCLLDEGSVTPMFIMHQRNGDLRVIPAWTTSPGQKQALYMFLKLNCIAYDAIGFSFICEAWMRSIGKADMQDHVYTGPKPSEAPDRIEVATVTLVYRDLNGQRKFMTASGKILRDAAGKPIGLDVLEPTYNDITGDVPDILPEQPSTAAEQVRASELIERLPAALNPINW